MAAPARGKGISGAEIGFVAKGGDSKGVERRADVSTGLMAAMAGGASVIDGIESNSDRDDDDSVIVASGGVGNVRTGSATILGGSD